MNKDLEKRTGRESAVECSTSSDGGDDVNGVQLSEPEDSCGVQPLFRSSSHLELCLSGWLGLAILKELGQPKSKRQGSSHV
jgi:hypothetical protein